MVVMLMTIMTMMVMVKVIMMVSDSEGEGKDYGTLGKGWAMKWVESQEP